MASSRVERKPDFAFSISLHLIRTLIGALRKRVERAGEEGGREEEREVAGVWGRQKEEEGRQANRG